MSPLSGPQIVGSYDSKIGAIGDQMQRVTGQELYVYASNGG